MKLTTKGRFAVTAMLDLALHESLAHDAMAKGVLPSEIKPVTLAGISERQKISLSYLEQLFSRLRRQGLDPRLGRAGTWRCCRGRGAGRLHPDSDTLESQLELGLIRGGTSGPGGVAEDERDSEGVVRDS